MHARPSGIYFELDGSLAGTIDDVTYRQNVIGRQNGEQNALILENRARFSRVLYGEGRQQLQVDGTFFVMHNSKSGSLTNKI